MDVCVDQARSIFLTDSEVLLLVGLNLSLPL